MSISQATIVGLPQPQSWDEYERGCLATFGGGYQTEEEREIFRHGMKTVFNLLRAEFPPAQVCKTSAGQRDVLLAECEFLQDLAEEVGAESRVGNIEQVALRHISRRISAAIAKVKETT